MRISSTTLSNQNGNAVSSRTKQKSQHSSAPQRTPGDGAGTGPLGLADTPKGATIEGLKRGDGDQPEANPDGSFDVRV